MGIKKKSKMKCSTFNVPGLAERVGVSEGGIPDCVLGISQGCVTLSESMLALNIWQEIQAMWLTPGRTGLGRECKGHAGKSTHLHTARPAQDGPASSSKDDLRHRRFIYMKNGWFCSSYFRPVSICWWERGYVRWSWVPVTYPKDLWW